MCYVTKFDYNENLIFSLRTFSSINIYFLMFQILYGLEMQFFM